MWRRIRPSPTLAVLAATCLWGTTGPARTLAGTGASPLALGAARLLAGAAVLGLVALARRPRPWRRLTARAVPIGGPWLALAALATAAFQASFFAAVDRTGAALATLVALAAAPVTTGVAARWSHAEPLGAPWALATTAAVAGCALLVLPGGGAGVDAGGVALALVAACCVAGYTVAGKHLGSGGRAVEGAIAVTLLGGGALLAPALPGSAAALLDPRSLAVVAWLGLACTAAGYVLFVHGLRAVPAATAATLGLAEPLVALALGVLLLGERVEPLALAGGALLLAGTIAAARPPARRASSPLPDRESPACASTP